MNKNDYNWFPSMVWEDFDTEMCLKKSFRKTKKVLDNRYRMC